MYLMFSCYNALVNKKMEKIIFVMTMCTSLYFGLEYGCNYKLLLLCNIPILICYFKKEKLLAIVLSLIAILFLYLKYDFKIYITVIKFISYYITYLLLYKRKEFNYLFFKISAIIQGFFISFEYFSNVDIEIDRVIDVIIYILIIYVLTFFSLYLFKLADNISNLYLTVNRVKEENKLKNSLFKLTHEIKNPLAVCKGYLDMINLDDINKSKKYINIIKSEIDRSLNVMADFMDYSKIKINRELFDMCVLMDDIYESFWILIKDKNIKFNYKNMYDEVYLMGDYDRLKQVFVNIIKNSVESILDNGIIDMEVLLDNNKVIITIMDNGIGMDKEELKNIYEMFYTTKKDGTGLGVTLSNEIIMAHKGRLIYESEKNKGTKCIIELPI